MRPGRLLLVVCGVAALAAASGVFIVALALALYAALLPALGAAGAAAAVAATCFIFLFIAGMCLLLFNSLRPRRPATPEGADLGAELLALARQRPVLAMVAAAAATAISLSALRNPRFAAGVFRYVVGMTSRR